MPINISHTTEDSTLWIAFKQGDRVAFARLYDLYSQDLISYGYRVTTNRQLIKDSIQDLFLYLWQTRENIANTDSVKFYLYRSLRNRIVRIQQETNRIPLADLDCINESIWSDASIEFQIVASETWNEQVNRLRKFIEGLPKRQQEVIQLRYYHEFTPEQVAAIMDINPQSVRNLLSRAIATLRQSFNVGFLLWLIISQLLY